MRFETRAIDPPPVDPVLHDPEAAWVSPQCSLWGWGRAAGFDPAGDRFGSARRWFTDLVAEAEVDDPLSQGGSGPVAFASLTFAPGALGSVMVIPAVVVGRRHGEWWMTRVDGADVDLGAPVAEWPTWDRARYAGSTLPDLLWMEAVVAALDRIGAGEVEKVVLARDYAVWSRTPFHPPRLLTHLQERFPDCHVFRVAGLIGASPELLARRSGRRVESMVLAGSAATAAALLGSEKDRWEHALSVGAVRETLTPICSDLEHPAEPEVLTLANVHHLATGFTGTQHRDLDALELVERLHPTAAVAGVPTNKAMALIAELEGMDRGRYAGPVGWMDARGDGEYAIALRCAEVSGARARLFAGAGIVSGSLPEAELDETRLKLSAMMGALAD